MSNLMPPRTLGPLHQVFWDYCSKGEFRLQQCDGCARWFWPPTSICDTCSGQDLGWKRVSGLGEVVSSCSFEREYYREFPPPHDVIVVKLAEGPLFLSNPKGFAYGDIMEGLRVRVTFVDREDQAGPYKLPVFERDLP